MMWTMDGLVWKTVHLWSYTFLNGFLWERKLLVGVAGHMPEMFAEFERL